MLLRVKNHINARQKEPCSYFHSRQVETIFCVSETYHDLERRLGPIWSLKLKSVMFEFFYFYPCQNDLQSTLSYIIVDFKNYKAYVARVSSNCELTMSFL